MPLKCHHSIHDGYLKSTGTRVSPPWLHIRITWRACGKNWKPAAASLRLGHGIMHSEAETLSLGLFLSGPRCLHTLFQGR